MKKHIIKYPIILRISAIFYLVIAILTFTLITGCYRNSAGVIVAGSTSVQPFAEVLAEEYMILHPGINIDVQGGGSAAGIMVAQSGTADIGMSSRALKDDEKSLWYVEIAKDGLAIIVHPDNPVNNLTLEEVRDIYSGETNNWSLLGGTKSEIHVFAREDGSGTRSSFESLMMGKTEIMARAMVQDSNGAVRQLVADDPSAIGFISLGLVDKTVKAMELDGVMPTREHVIDGSYGLSRPFLFLSLKEPAGLIKDFIDFTLSEKGRELLNAEGLVTTGVNP
ncbi:MAG: phosphate ABC transporter substrate-binding protein [Dehalococcoidales bacterium]|nr:phosphate ABC transporter substrate-binding protein [Dehalococcoidales bacterium]